MKSINCSIIIFNFNVDVIKFSDLNDNIIINVDNDVQIIVEQFSNQSNVKLDASNGKKKLENEKSDSEFNANDVDFESEKTNKSQSQFSIDNHQQNYKIRIFHQHLRIF